MSAPINFVHRLVAVIKPTRGQILGSFLLSLALLTIAQSRDLLLRLGVSQQALSATGIQFHIRFDSILRSSVASQLALVTFWAVVGLVAYLVCWGAYNIIIEARNEVTLSTTYTNRGHWRGPYETLALKAAAGVGLGATFLSLWPGISFWLALSAQTVTQPSITTAVLATLAVIGCAFQLYAMLAFFQLTFTPWYREQAFTGV